jgi:phosphorylcholine metabolism protein LicD/GT2 family glycosyltransferase
MCGVIVNSKSKVEVSVIVPVFNEEKYISECVYSILEQDFIKISSEGESNTEIIFVDGRSTDGTRKILEEICEKSPLVKVFDNPRKTVQFALNIGINAARGRFIVRMDSHACYAKDYVKNSVEILRLTGAQNVGGPMVAKGKSLIQDVIAACYHSPFALGGGAHHDVNFEGFTETVNYGTFDAVYIKSIGMYDETLPLNEDDDLNFRINETGGKVYVSPKIKYVYYPRSSFLSLAKQYFGYGFWKVSVIKKHGRPANIRHLIPGAFVFFLILSTILCLCSKKFLPVFIIPIAIYLILSIYFCLTNKCLKGGLNKFLLLIVHVIMHVSYGAGFLLGIFKIKESKIKTLKLTSVQIRSLQLMSLEILLYFKKFCKANNLKFFLCGGCCIGAVRNARFIPWDDDIDVFMPRKDYENFYRIWKDNERFCLAREQFIKVIDKYTQFVRKEDLFSDRPRGVAIDVFPLDGFPDSKFKRVMQVFNALVFSFFSSKKIPENHGKLAKVAGWILLKLVPKNIKNNILNFCESNMSKHKISDCSFITELCAGPKYMMKKYPKYVFELEEVKYFEGYEVPLPCGYHEYLSIAFGDYMILPPEEKRKPHHDILLFNQGHC